MSKPLEGKPAVTRQFTPKDEGIGQMTRSELKAFVLDLLRHQTHEMDDVLATKITVKELIVTSSIDTP